MIETEVIIAAICAGAVLLGLIGAFTPKAKIIAPKFGAILICVGVVGLGLWYGGYLKDLGVVGDGDGNGDVADVFTYKVTGADEDANLTYNDTDRVFTVNVTENTTAGTCTPDNVTFTLTLTRTDTIGGEDDVAKITSSVTGFLSQVDTTDTRTYYPVTKTGNDFNVEITPSGGSMTRGSAQALMTPASSKEFTFVVQLSDDIDELKLYNSKDITINAEGTVFKLRVLLNAQEA